MTHVFMKPLLIPLLGFLFLISCTRNYKERYTKIAEGESVNPKMNERYGILEQKIVVLIDNKTNEVIYYDVWDERIVYKRKL